jgi:hypothetical protein
LAAKETVLKDSLAEVKSKNSRLSESIRALANEPSDADLAVQLASYKKQVDALNARLARIKGDGKQVSKADMDKVRIDMRLARHLCLFFFFFSAPTLLQPVQPVNL